MKESVAELYSRYPFNEEERYWGSFTSLDASIAAASDLHDQEDPLSYLDTVRETDRDRAYAIGNALRALPAQVVVDTYGPEVGLWTSLTSIISGDNRAINDVLRDSEGYNIADLNIARGWVWRKGPFGSSVKPVIAQYGLMQAIRSGATSAIDLPAILQDSAKQGITLSDSRLDDYNIIPIEVDNYNNVYDGGRVKDWDEDLEKNIRYTSWLDTPTGFALTYKGTPNAIAGLAMNGEEEIMLHQIQGVQVQRIDPTKSRYSQERITDKVSSRGLAPIDWQRVLIDGTEQIARSMNIPRLGIQAAKNNVWTKPYMSSDTEAHLPIEKAVKAYDEPASRLGFTRDTDGRGNWHKIR